MKNKRSGKKRTIPRILVPGFISFILLLAAFFYLSGKKWDAVSRYTFVVHSNPLIVVSVEPATKRSVVVTFPSNALLSLPYGYGSYQASSVFPLGELDNTHGGGKLLMRSIEETLGAPVYGYLSFGQEIVLAPDRTDISQLKKKYFSASNILLRFPSFLRVIETMTTNISVVDMYQLWMAIRNIRSDTVVHIDTQMEGLLQKTILPDGSIQYVIDTDTFANRYPDIFQDHAVRLEEKTVEVVNATKEPSVAARFGHILETMGAHVLVKSTSQSEMKDPCVIAIKSKQMTQSIIVARLKSYYGCTIGKGSLDTDVVDLRVTLGVGFIQ